jgi:plastocyanin
MNGKVSRFVALGLSLLAFGCIVAAGGDEPRDQAIVINIVGPAGKAKYIKEGEKEEKPVDVNVGQTVRWVNKGTMEHSVTSFLKKDDKPVFNTGLFNPEDQREIKFDRDIYTKAGGKPGEEVELKYFCTKHPTSMRNGQINLYDRREKKEEGATPLRYSLSITGFTLSDSADGPQSAISWNEVDVSKFLHVSVSANVPPGVNTLRGRYRKLTGDGTGNPSADKDLGVGKPASGGRFEFTLTHFILVGVHGPSLPLRLEVGTTAS